jgi:hypothetical protein
VTDAADQDTQDKFYNSYNNTNVENSKYQLPYNKLLIKLRDSTTEEEKDQIKNGM